MMVEIAVKAWSRQLATYASRNNPASLRHLTLVVIGKRPRNSSQWIIVANPPAEHPERRAWSKIKCTLHENKYYWHSIIHISMFNSFFYNLIGKTHSLWHQIFHGSCPNTLSSELQFSSLFWQTIYESKYSLNILQLIDHQVNSSSTRPQVKTRLNLKISEERE